MNTDKTSPDTALRIRLKELDSPHLIEELNGVQSELETLTNQLELEDCIMGFLFGRAKGLSVAVLTSHRLDEKFERLIEHIRGKERSWPGREVLAIAEGMIAKLIVKRIWVFTLSFLTFIPAVLTLFFLASQNKILNEQNRIDTEAETKILKEQFLTAIYETSFLEEDGFPEHPLPRWHHRLRAEAVSSLIPLEKASWSKKERESLPPVRYLSLANANLHSVTLGADHGLVADEPPDVSRIDFRNSELSRCQIYTRSIDGCDFTGSTANSMQIWTRSAKHVNFSSLSAANAVFRKDEYYQDYSAFHLSSFADSDLAQSRYFFIGLENCDFKKTNLAEARFTGCRLSQCDLSRANLRDIEFIGCQLEDLSLEDVDLRKIDLRNNIVHNIDVTNTTWDDSLLLPDGASIRIDPSTGKSLIQMDEEERAKLRKKLQEEGYIPQAWFIRFLY